MIVNNNMIVSSRCQYDIVRSPAIGEQHNTILTDEPSQDEVIVVNSYI